VQRRVPQDSSSSLAALLALDCIRAAPSLAPLSTSTRCSGRVSPGRCTTTTVRLTWFTPTDATPGSGSSRFFTIFTSALQQMPCTRSCLDCKCPASVADAAVAPAEPPPPPCAAALSPGAPQDVFLPKAALSLPPPLPPPASMSCGLS